jgi:hypothetical protein
MGPPVAELKGANHQKLASSTSNNLSNNENVVGCCQGVDGGSCCRSENFEQNKVVDETTEALQKQGNKLGWSWPIFGFKK